MAVLSYIWRVIKAILIIYAKKMLFLYIFIMLLHRVMPIKSQFRCIFI